MASADYVVVGGGTAGCVLAARLSEDDRVRVLLLEAGDRHPASAPPLAWPTLLTSTASWGDHSVEQAVGGRRVELAQGRGLGGGSAINALGHLRGHRLSYDAWSTAAPGWSFDDLLPFFERSERAPTRDPQWRGQDGPLTVGPVADRPEVTSAWLRAAAEAGLPVIDDPSAGVEEGLGWSDYNVVDGHRQSAADAYLTPARARSNLQVTTGATVHRLLIDGERVVGVRYEQAGRVTDVAADVEVVLTAGAVGTPQLLMLSGIGPDSHLDDVGVSTVLDHPGVGGNLQDHPLGAVTYLTADALPLEAARPPGGALGVLRSGLLPAGNGPDLQLGMLDLPFSPSEQPGPSQGFSITFAAMAPRSRGTVRLADADPSTRPLIDPRYFSEDADVDVMVAGLRLARRVARGAALAPWRPHEALPGGDGGDDEHALRTFVREHSGSYHHLAGTCRLGTDHDAVVDPQLRLRGLAGLRIADSSVIPALPSANINATVVGLAERAADLVLGR